MTYGEIKTEAANRFEQLAKDCGLFWAFSTEQFNKYKTPLQPGEKYVDIGSGGFMPRHNVDKYIQGMKAIEKWQKSEVKKDKEVQERAIVYELNNYECFYTGDISNAMPALKSLGFTREQVKKVFAKTGKAKSLISGGKCEF